MNTGKNDLLDQPCCSKSLSPDDASHKAANATTSIPPDFMEDDISPEQLEEFFEVDTLTQTQPPNTNDIPESGEVEANQNVLLEHTWT